MNKKLIIEDLLDERKNLIMIIHDAEKRVEKAPEGSVRIIKHRKGYQYYLRKKPSEKTGTYIPSSERQKAVSLIQKKYDIQVLSAAGKQLKAIDRFLRVYDPEVIKKIGASLPEVRKACVQAAVLPDREYAEKWKAYEFTPKEFAEDAPEHYTGSGERVRSKSEVMIADALQQAGILYRYECPLELGGKILYPDFTILRQGDREELYWEHLGMMDDPEYCHNALRKIRLYEGSGIYPGVRLITTMETSRIPINLTVIKSIIQTYCT